MLEYFTYLGMAILLVIGYVGLQIIYGFGESLGTKFYISKGQAGIVKTPQECLQVVYPGFHRFYYNLTLDQVIDTREQITTMRKGRVKLEDGSELIVKATICYKYFAVDGAYHQGDVSQKARDILLSEMEKMVNRIGINSIECSRKFINDELEKQAVEGFKVYDANMWKIENEGMENPYPYSHLGVEITRILVEDLDIEQKATV